KCRYLEWFSNHFGRVVIQSTRLVVERIGRRGVEQSEEQWRGQRQQNQPEMNYFTTQLGDAKGGSGSEADGKQVAVGCSLLRDERPAAWEVHRLQPGSVAAEKPLATGQSGGSTKAVMEKTEPDWDPRSAEALHDQRAVYDQMREQCPVAYSDFLQWSLFRHEDVLRVINDHLTFSNAVSRHLSVPNGMDPPEHTPYRRIIEPYFSPERMAAFEPVCREIVVDLVCGALASGQLELMAELAVPFAAHAQCAFLGWPPSLYSPLIRWTHNNYHATLARDRQALAELARQFEGYIDELLDERLQA